MERGGQHTHYRTLCEASRESRSLQLQHLSADCFCGASASAEAVRRQASTILCHRVARTTLRGDSESDSPIDADGRLSGTKAMAWHHRIRWHIVTSCCTSHLVVESQVSKRILDEKWLQRIDFGSPVRQNVIESSFLHMKKSLSVLCFVGWWWRVGREGELPGGDSRGASLGG